MTVSAFISDDGYSETCFLLGRRGMYPHVRFVYRPIPIVDRTAALEELDKIAARPAGNAVDAFIAEKMASRMESWELLGDDGKQEVPAPAITGSILLRAKPALFLRMAAVIFYGSMGGDDDPFEGTTASKLTSAAQLESDQKN